MSRALHVSDLVRQLKLRDREGPTTESRRPTTLFCNWSFRMSDDWKIYRTRFVVRARQLIQPFTFTDVNGREHHGRPGDYLIESHDGLRISRREIFEDVYVAMEAAESLPSRSLARIQPPSG